MGSLRFRRLFRRAIFSIVASVALSGGTAGTLAAQQPALAPLRILALGDSITAGVVAPGLPVSGGYRALLERLLAAAPRKAVLVGTRNDFSSSMNDPWHDGWPGYVMRATSPGAPGELYGGLAKRAVSEAHPDVVLLMVGTNDFLRYQSTDGTYSVDEMVHSMDLLLGDIYSVAPKVRVIVGAIVDSPKIKACYVERFDTGHSQCDPDTHPSLAGLVVSYASRGYAISYAAALYHAVPRDLAHFPDGIHPADGPGGYDAIARVWFDAIEAATATDERPAVVTAKSQHKPHD